MKKTRMVWVSKGGKSFTICLAVSTQYRRVMDRGTDRQTNILQQRSPRYAYASHAKHSKMHKLLIYSTQLTTPKEEWINKR